MTDAPDHGELVWIRHADLRPGPNPRRTFDDDEIAALAESIAAQGLLQNLVVTLPLLPEHAANGVRVLVAGERRWRAIGRLIEEERWAEDRPLPCRLVDADPGTVRALSILENLQRQDVPPLEEAEAFRDLHALDSERWSVTAIAEAIGRTPRFVQQRIAVATKLAPEAKTLLAEGKLTFTQARELVTLPAGQQKRTAEEASWKLRSAGDAIARRALGSMFPLAHARFDLAEYDGEIYEADDGARYAVNRKAAMKLQEAWAKARAEQIGGATIRADAWFEPGRGHWRGGWKYASGAAEKKRAVTLITVDGSTGAITEFEGVVQRKAEEDKPGKALHDSWQRENEQRQALYAERTKQADAVRADLEARDPADLFLLLSTLPRCATAELAATIARMAVPSVPWAVEASELSAARMLLLRLLGVPVPDWCVLEPDEEHDDEDDKTARPLLAALDAGTYVGPATPRIAAEAIAAAPPLPPAGEGRGEGASATCATCAKPLPRARCHYRTCPQKEAAA